MPSSTDKYKSLFISEAEDQLANLSRSLLELEKNPSAKERYSELMRNAHTIKGAAATMGYAEIADLSHAIEDVFHAGERGSIVISAEAVSLLLSSLDTLSAQLSALKERDETISGKDWTEKIQAFLTGAVLAPVTQKATPPAVEQRPLSDQSDRLKTLTTVRVGTERLDTLMGLLEEMLMIRLKLNALLGPAEETIKELHDPLLKQKLFFVNEFGTLFIELARLLSETQEELLKIRLVPLEQIFGQFPRLIRDTSVAAGKSVKFNVIGSDIELDRTVIDGLGGALAHLLRNTIAHGIVGEGDVTLSAVRERDRVLVAVEDNGRGVDYERVRVVAVERKLLKREEADRLDHAQLATLIFNPNMSTTVEVDKISGRGVGLFSVKAFAEDVGGRISVVSPVTEKGGTRFTLDLPTSIATLEVLLVESRSYIFAISFRNIVRTLAVAKSDITGSLHQESVIIDERPVPIVRLDRVLGLDFGRNSASDDEAHEAVLLSVDNSSVVLIVDGVVGEQELLIKALPPVLRGLGGFSGSALLPDGRTILLLDVHGLLSRALSDILEKSAK
jgi:two-component system, chemotaxis family, sensor kinase CheA